MPDSTTVDERAKAAPQDNSGATAAPELDCSSRLSAGLLLLAGWFGEGETHRVSLQRNEQERELESVSYPYRLPDHPGDSGRRRTLLMVVLPTGPPLRRGDRLTIRGSGGELDLSWRELKSSLTDLKTFSRTTLAPLDGEDRACAMTFLARALAIQPRGGVIQLSETLFQLRTGLREHLPVYQHAADRPRGLAVESIMAVDDCSFYIEGWARDEESEIVRMSAVSPEGDRAQLAGRLYHFRRPDVSNFFSAGVLSRKDRNEKVGFISFFELDSPSYLGTGWVLEMENAQGDVLETECPPVLHDSKAARDRILSDAGRERLPDDELMENHVMPALVRFQEHVEASIKIESVTEFGQQPESPEVSIVIPLYRRVDLIEQQLAEFVLDPEISESDLLFVLDSPEQKDELLFLASRLFPVYRVPMRVAILERNVGFAGANNAGASIARGRLLMLMNSDVLPDKPGWLGVLSRFHDSTPNIGALAPKLLYEDGSIQNAGMRFHRPHGTSVWLDDHYFRGLHRGFPAANVPRKVPLLSGACVMIARALYEQLGGLRGVYVQGDYEDTDLCMRLNELGRDNWYMPEAEVFHLEGTSYSSDMRMPANRYNGWLHTHLWKDHIGKLMSRYEVSDGAGGDS